MSRVSLIAALVLASASTSAHADQVAAPVTVTCEFVEVWATTSPAEKAPKIDGAIAKSLASKLGKVKQWNDYRQLSTVTKTLAKKQDEKLTLSKGSAVVTFVELVDKSKVRLSIEFASASAKNKTSQKQLIDAGDWVTTAVQQPNGDGHLLAGSCK